MALAEPASKSKLEGLVASENDLLWCVMQVNSMREQKQNQSDAVLVLKIILKFTGDKWISGFCWGRRVGGDMVVLL